MSFSDAPDGMIGKQIDNFRVIKRLGEGGMATVYLAEDVALKRDVVLKILKQSLAQQEELRLRFQREAQATARLHHPNIVPIYTTGVTPNNLPYIALQHIEGGSLSEHLEKLASEGKWISTIYALSIGHQIATALVVAHEKGIIHRDLKPSNILLQPDGTPVLSDLGIAAVQQATMRLTQTGGIVGTPYYMSPEQAGGQPIDGRSDLYSLGVILYELLSGRLPFDADSPLAILHKHIYEQPAPLNQVRPGLTRDTYTLVKTALQKQPDVRYSTAAGMAAAVERALRSEDQNPLVSVIGDKTVIDALPSPETTAGNTPSGTGAHNIRPRLPRPWIWLIPLLALAVVLGIGAGFLLTREEPLAAGAVAPVAVESRTPTATSAAATATLAPPTTPTRLPLPTSTQALPVVEPTLEESPAPEAYTITVAGTQPRTLTSIEVQAGQRVSIAYVDGSWRAGPAPTWPVVGPGGDPQVSSKVTFPVPDAPVVSLIAGIGDGEPFYVGEATSFVSPSTGTLWFGANDDDHTDNMGALTLDISLGEIGEVPITPVPAGGPTGTVAYSCGEGTIYLYDVARQTESLLLNQPFPSAVPAFSPDGGEISYRSSASGSWQIYASKLDGSDLAQITANGTGNNHEAVWSPDGERFVFVSDRTGTKNIFVMNTDGMEQRQLTFNDAYNDDPNWSNYDEIVYESDQDGRFNLYVLPPAGGTPRLLIERGDSVTTPAWSPDGSTVAFESRDGSIRQLWIANRDGTNVRQVTTQGTDNQRPAWSPDGRYLAFHSNFEQDDDESFDIWIVEVETGVLQQISNRGNCVDPAWNRR